MPLTVKIGRVKSASPNSSPRSKPAKRSIARGATKWRSSSTLRSPPPNFCRTSKTTTLTSGYDANYLALTAALFLKRSSPSFRAESVSQGVFGQF